MKKHWSQTEWFASLIFVVAVFTVWFFVGLVADDFVFPPLLQTMQSAAKMLGSSDFWTAAANTLLHTAIGFVCAYTVGFLLALLVTAKPLCKPYFAPLVSLIRLLPTMAIVLAVCLWASDAVAPAIVAFTVVMPTIYASVSQAFSLVDGELLEMAAFYQVSKPQMLTKIWIPLTLPALVDGLANGLSLTLKLTVAAEVLVGSYQSLGGLMWFAKNVYFDSAALFAVTLWTVAVGLAMQGLVRLVFWGFSHKKRRTV